MTGLAHAFARALACWYILRGRRPVAWRVAYRGELDIGPDRPGLIYECVRLDPPGQDHATGCADRADWANQRYPGRCYFYPGRDCPGWTPGTRCGRVGNPIPADAVGSWAHP